MDRAALEELQAKRLPHCAWTDIFLAKEGGEIAEADQAALADYFAHFLPPREDCAGCGSKLVSRDIIDVAIGTATFEWGLVNGEGHCSRCRWPARAYHRDVGPIKFLNCILQYHPNELSIRTEADHG